MRYTYSDNSMVAHLWAHQQQESAKSSNGHFYFEGKTIYSYGSHFPICRIVENLSGERKYIFNSGSYSSTTSNHQSLVRQAIPDTSDILYSKGCVSPGVTKSGVLYGYSSAVEFVIERLKNILELIPKYQRAKKIDYAPNILGSISKIKEWIDFWGLDKEKTKWVLSLWSRSEEEQKMPSLIKYMLRKGDVLTIDRIYGCRDHSENVSLRLLFSIIVKQGLLSKGQHIKEDLDALIEAYCGSDVAKKIANAQKKYNSDLVRARKQREEADYKRSVNELAKWKSGDLSSWTPTSAFEKRDGYHTALRLSYTDPEIIQTSKGVKINASEAERLWKLVSYFHSGGEFKHEIALDLSGNKWAINSYSSDILKAGCHLIHYSECESIAKQLGFIK